MGSFLNFLKVLLFSNTVLLTPDPVSFYGEHEIYPEEPLVAITSGPSLRIDISQFAAGINIKEKGIVESRKQLRKLIPEESVEAKLYSNSDSILFNDIGFALTDVGASVILSSKEKIPVDIEFIRVEITSQIELRDVQIYWRNFDM